MDPITLFALANGAVSAVKAGCKLYKDIKGAAGDVKDVLKDLDQQFHNLYEGKGRKPPPEAVKQLAEEKARVKDLNKRSNETTNLYQEIGEHLGVYYDNYYKCLAVFEEEERRSRTEVYTGDASLGKRALQRVLMRKQLEAMSTELRELMVYQSPKELGALYTEVEEMMKQMGKEQKTAIADQMRRSMRQAEIDRKRKDRIIHRSLVLGIVAFSLVVVVLMFTTVVESRIRKYPELGNCAVPKGSWLYYKWTRLEWATCH